MPCNACVNQTNLKAILCCFNDIHSVGFYVSKVSAQMSLVGRFASFIILNLKTNRLKKQTKETFSIQKKINA